MCRCYWFRYCGAVIVVKAVGYDTMSSLMRSEMLGNEHGGDSEVSQVEDSPASASASMPAPTASQTWTGLDSRRPHHVSGVKAKVKWVMIDDRVRPCMGGQSSRPIKGKEIVGRAGRKSSSQGSSRLVGPMSFATHSFIHDSFCPSPMTVFV